MKAYIFVIPVQSLFTVFPFSYYLENLKLYVMFRGKFTYCTVLN